MWDRLLYSFTLVVLLVWKFALSKEDFLSYFLTRSNLWESPRQSRGFTSINYLVAVVGIVFVGLSPIWVALADVSPATAAFFGSIYALPALTLIWFFAGRGDERSALKSPDGS